MPIFKDVSISHENKHVDKEDNLPNRKSFLPVDENSHNFCAIETTSMADDHPYADAQQGAPKDDDFQRIPNKRRERAQNKQKSSKEQHGEQHMHDECAPDIEIGQINKGQIEQEQGPGKIT